MCNSTAVSSRTKSGLVCNSSPTKMKVVATSPEPELEAPSNLARYTCASILVGIFAVWGKYTFVEESSLQLGDDLHSYKYPMAFTAFYLVSLPLLRELVARYTCVDMKLLLKESMILYNAGQVVLNVWMVYRFLQAVMFRGHPFVGDLHTLNTGATFAVWVHYCDKYLEFLDTYFMVLRGKMDQVSFLHVYHHFTIAWAWWIGLWCWPGGDSYFGALLNSLIHVMMYSYYTMTLLHISCPWKRYLTMAQLLQFTTVIVYSVVSTCKIYAAGAEPRHYVAIVTQCGEMISLFVLFMHFYNKAYNKKNKEAKALKAIQSAAVTKGPGSPLRDSETESGSEQSSIASDESGAED